MVGGETAPEVCHVLSDKWVGMGSGLATSGSGVAFIHRRRCLAGFGLGGGLSETLPECGRCGRCCFSAAEAYVPVRGEDWSRLADAAERVAHFIGNRAFMRMAGGHCAALQVNRGVDGPSVFFCTVYEHRPQVCRDLARGSPQCEADRASKPSPLSLE